MNSDKGSPCLPRTSWPNPDHTQKIKKIKKVWTKGQSRKAGEIVNSRFLVLSVLLYFWIYKSIAKSLIKWQSKENQS